MDILEKTLNQEEKYRSLIENAPNIIVIITRDGTIEFINRTVPGISVEETLGRSIYDYIEPEYHNIARKTIEQVFQSGESDSYEARVTVPDGYLWYDTQVGPIKHGEQVVSATLITTDITKRKQAEEMLQKRTHELGKRVKELNCLYGISNLVDKPGVSLEEIFQGTVNLIPSSWQYPEITCARVILEHQEFRTENFRETVWRQASDIVVHDERLGAVEVCYLEERQESDEGPFLKEERSLLNAIAERLGRITESKRTEKALRESEAKNRSILNAIPDLMFSISKDGIFLDFLATEGESLFIPPSEFIGKKVYEVLPTEVAQATMHNLEQALQTGDIQIFEYQLPIQGKIRDFDARIVASGEDQVLAISRDITERKEIDLMKNQFVSTVSHELRTPLTSIHGSLGLILGGAAGELPPQTKGLLDIAYNNSERLTRLINDILDIEKIESGKMEFNFQPLELMSLVKQAIEANHAYAEQFEIEFVLKDTLTDAKVNADSDRLMQLFANLLSNAAKFSPPNDTVEISVSRHDKAIRVAITDHGPGIPEKFRSRVFEKFAQADSSDARQKRGTGLGLSIAKAIVEKHGGKICFDTEINVGTTFYFDLPEWHEQEVAAITDANPQHQPRILICEDDCDVANLLRMMLNQADFNTDIAYDAAQAKQLLAQNQYVAMTLDLILPGQDGISLIRELREQEHTRDLPIVVVSIKADDGRNELNGGAFGIIDWLDKPIDEVRLIAAVKQAVLQSARSHPENRDAGSKPRILHVEDDPDVLQVVSAILKDDATVSYAANLHDAKQLLKQETYDLVILDLALPDGSGLDLLPLLNRQTTSIPVVIFSAYEVGIEVARNVAATLVKSRTSNQELLDTIKSLIRHSD